MATTATYGGQGGRDQWLAVRGRLREHRHRLGAVAAARYPGWPTVAGTSLLTRPSWVPARPVPLSAVELVWRATPPTTGWATGYAEAMAAWDRPAVFENRPTYRLLSATVDGAARLEFGPGRYFDHLDTGEAAAHELAAGGPTPLRDAIGDPCDLAARPANLAISVLTVRGGPSPTFFLHWRDPARVGHAGGLYQVLPVGVFQPAGADHRAADFSLWHCVLREYAEELLGRPEQSDVDYRSWPFALAVDAAVRAGGVRAHCLGLGVDPLTFATDLLVSVVFDPAVFDELFAARVSVNDEGRVLERPFTAEAIADLPMQPAGAAVVRLALG